MLFGILLSGTSLGQLQHYNFEEIEKLQLKAPRLLMVFIHTDWCGYCRTMQNTTFDNENIINILNDKYYFISFNPEKEQHDIVFYGRTFVFKPSGRNVGVHQLAQELGSINGLLGYPTLVVLTPQREIVFQHNGMITSKEFLLLLQYLSTKQETSYYLPPIPFQPSNLKVKSTIFA